MKALHVSKPPLDGQLSRSVRIAGAFVLGVVGCLTPGCLDPLVEDPGAADHAPGPTPTLPGAPAPAGVVPTTPSATSDLAPSATTPLDPGATATGVPVNPAQPSSTQPVAPPTPVTPPQPSEPVSSDAGAEPEFDGGETSGDESARSESTPLDMDGGLDGGAPAAVQ